MRSFGLGTLIVLALTTHGTVETLAHERVLANVPHTGAVRVMRLARLGNVRAQSQLGWMYATGRGVPQDYFEAAKWYYRAADRGDGRAQLELGLMYNKGRGVPRDYVLAEMWLNLSAASAIGDNRDFIARLRDAVASKMTPQQLSVAQHLALIWRRSH